LKKQPIFPLQSLFLKVFEEAFALSRWLLQELFGDVALSRGEGETFGKKFLPPTAPSLPLQKLSKKGILQQKYCVLFS